MQPTKSFLVLISVIILQVIILFVFSIDYDKDILGLSGGYVIKASKSNSTYQPSRMQVLAINLFPIFNRDQSLTQTFPIGQMFDLSVIIYDFDGVGINNISLIISRKRQILTTANLLCEKQGDVNFCIEGLWNAINVKAGSNLYTVKITGFDNSGKYVSKIQDINISFRRVSNTKLCKELIQNHNKPTVDRANIVFVGFGYQNVTGKTPQDALKYVAKTVIDINGQNKGLFSVEPFKSNKNKFNFWYINKLGSIGDCKSVSGECHLESALPFAESCVVPNKYITTLVDNNTAASGSGGRYATLSAIVVDSTFDKENLGGLFVHEFGGHSFGRLRDEYIVFFEKMVDYETSNSSFRQGKNCYAGPKHTAEEALENAPWKYLIGNGCGQHGIIDCIPGDENYYVEIGIFEGCAKDGLGIFRPTRVSIMGGDPKYQPPYPYSFGLWNEKLITDELNKLKGG